MQTRLLRLGNLVLDMHTGSFLGAGVYEEIQVGGTSLLYIEGLDLLMRMYPDFESVEFTTTASTRIYSMKINAGGRKVIGIYNFASKFWTIFDPKVTVMRGFPKGAG